MHNNPRAASGHAGGQVCAVFQTGELLLLVLLLVLCGSQRSASPLLPLHTLQPSAHCGLQLSLPTKCFCSEDQCHRSKMDVLLSPVICGGNVARSYRKYFGMTAEIRWVGLSFCCLGPGPRSHSTTVVRKFVLECFSLQNRNLHGHLKMCKAGRSFCVHFL